MDRDKKETSQRPAKFAGEKRKLRFDLAHRRVTGPHHPRRRKDRPTGR